MSLFIHADAGSRPSPIPARCEACTIGLYLRVPLSHLQLQLVHRTRFPNLSSPIPPDFAQSVPAPAEIPPNHHPPSKARLKRSVNRPIQRVGRSPNGTDWRAERCIDWSSIGAEWCGPCKQIDKDVFLTKSSPRHPGSRAQAALMHAFWFKLVFPTSRGYKCLFRKPIIAVRVR